MLNRLLRQQLLHLPDAEELEGGLDDAVEQESKVDQQDEADNLQPLKCFPAQAERDHPDEERAARVDGGARGGAHAAGYGETEEVEATVEKVSVSGCCCFVLLMFGGMGRKGVRRYGVESEEKLTQR